MPFALSKFRAKRLVAAAAALAFTLGGAAATRIALADDSANYPTASLTAPTDPAALIERGKYLTAAADCLPCHTGPGHQPFSGGLVMATPFGGLSTPNITPDKETGIGNWSDTDFYNALHYGTAPGHSYLVFPKFLYPAMPYTSYTKLSYADVMAIKAYLFSLAPVNVAPTPSSMAFPFNQRPVLLGWRLLFFSAGPMKMDPSWDEHMKNGAYLTEALGHCGECHTPRNILSAMELGRAYAGAPIDDLYAPNISSDKTQGVGGWAQADLVAYLHDGGNMVKGSPFGSMGDMVANSTSKLSVSDVVDIATYLQTATKPQQTTPPPAVADAAASIARGANVYTANCAGCHGKTGAGLPPRFAPNLAGNDSIIADEPYNVIGPVLSGLAPWTKLPMPSFATKLSDQEIADVANYVRTAWGNQGVANATPAQVLRLRGIASVPASADALSDTLGCPHISPAGGPNTVADPGNGLLNTYQGVTPETLANRTRTLVSAVRANNASISDADLTNTLVAAYCPVVAHTAGLSLSAKQEALRDFIAGAAPLIAAH
ncbi:c-type cytochrome [Acidocella aromatica]|uniref:Mono/diheme cytochrome c family protein n=1 Tax=Acidocella aromatica TaxID=1303579 RepID=A0A840VLP6_9PROT|nr:cytochrome c [Acidocella aromatica]MBB5372511.1 mono/diheme cytochrome c family protein [Acidocella aromatica]